MYCQCMNTEPQTTDTEYFIEQGRNGGKKSGEIRKKRAIAKAKRTLRRLESESLVDTNPPL